MSKRPLLFVTVVMAALCGCDSDDSDDSSASGGGTGAATGGGGASSSTGGDGAGASGSGAAGAAQSGGAGGSGGASTGVAGGAGGTGGQPFEYPLDDTLRLDHMQVRGTHNSYHIEPAIPFDPSHEYTHAPLDVQLEQQGVRSFEIDLHRALDDSYDVYHIAVIDAETTCGDLEVCLGLIKGWSDANRDHLPIMVWFEIKDSTGGLPIDDLAPIDAVITSVFPANQLLTPDDVRGPHANLREAITTDGWPTLGQVRGRVAFMVLNTGSYVDAYTAGQTSLAGRTMFVHTSVADFGLPYAAVSKINDPGSADIALAHASGILVASNVCGAGSTSAACDAKLAQGKTNGVHMLMDDFPAPVANMTYWLDLPDGNPARCNEQTAPPVCTSIDLENLP